MAKPAVIVPALDAGDTLSWVLSHMPPAYIVVVVDDGSVDRTSSIANTLGVHVLRHSRNLGVGAALKTAIGWARRNGFQSVVTLDADAQHDPFFIPAFTQTPRGADLVLGQRFASNITKVPHAKLSANLFAALIVRDVFGICLVDVACGYRAFVDLAVVEQFPDSYQFLYSHLFYLLSSGATVRTVNVPAVYFDDTPQATRVIELLGFLREIAKYLRRGRISAVVASTLTAVHYRATFKVVVAGVEFQGVFDRSLDSYTISAEHEEVLSAMSALADEVGPRK